MLISSSVGFVLCDVVIVVLKCLLKRCWPESLARVLLCVSCLSLWDPCLTLVRSSAPLVLCLDSCRTPSVSDVARVLIWCDSLVLWICNDCACSRNMRLVVRIVRSITVGRNYCCLLSAGSMMHLKCVGVLDYVLFVQ